MFYNNLHRQKAADYISALQGKPHSYRILYRHSNGFAIKNTVETYGNGDFTITSYATGAIMIKYPNTSMKTRYVGIMTNYMQKNKGMKFKFVCQNKNPRQENSVGG